MQDFHGPPLGIFLRARSGSAQDGEESALGVVEVWRSYDAGVRTVDPAWGHLFDGEGSLPKERVVNPAQPIG